MTLILSGTDGLSDVDGTAATPAIRGTDTNTGIFFPAADTIAFSEGGVESMRIDSSGNVGIGTSSPGFKLDVNGTGRVTTEVRVKNSAGNVSYLTFEENGNGNSATFISGDARTTGNIGFWTNSTERARIDSSGNLLVGTTNTSATAGVGFKAIVNDRFAIVSAGSTGATTSLSLYSTGAGAFRFFVQDSGNINATSTSITAISDVSLKENIRPLETGLTEVMALQPRRFDWKEETGLTEKNVAGFIAQEVETILPELVYEYQYNETETKKSLKMGDILPTLVKAIQEQQAIIQSLTARIEALEGK